MTELEKKVKYYKNNLVKLTRTSKANQYNNFFKENKLNLLKTLHGIRVIINIKPKETNYLTSSQFNNTTITDSNYLTSSQFTNTTITDSNYLTSSQFNNTTITDSKSIANIFSNHFTSIAKNRTKNNSFEIQIL